MKRLLLLLGATLGIAAGAAAQSTAASSVRSTAASSPQPPAASTLRSTAASSPQPAVASSVRSTAASPARSTLPSTDRSADIAAIKQLNADWIHNYMVKDTATFDRIFADDFILINPSGKKFTKKDVIANIGQPIVSAKVDTVEVQLHGNIGLVIAKCSFVTRAEGKESAGQTDYLDVYEKRKGRWWAIVAHVTYLGSPQ
ncbi:MAG TPA: nuclear transport factor 2 family protein [Puia sp.]|nr:nuclear transport factor 2 family protein [Puia sp.]